jgi:hypothetical protein
VIVELTPERQILYNRLNASRGDIAFARYCAELIARKKWHLSPWSRKRTQYPQQAAFTLALVVSYFRPFTKTHGWPDLPRDLRPADTQDAALHERLRKLRNTVYAHSGKEHHSARPWRAGELLLDIETAPPLMLSAEDIAQFLTMTASLQAKISIRMREIVEAAEGGHVD